VRRSPGVQAVGRPTLHGGPVIIRPVRAYLVATGLLYMLSYDFVLVDKCNIEFRKLCLSLNDPHTFLSCTCGEISLSTSRHS